jgi:hypothetical protein
MHEIWNLERQKEVDKKMNTEKSNYTPRCIPRYQNVGQNPSKM